MMRKDIDITQEEVRILLLGLTQKTAALLADTEITEEKGKGIIAHLQRMTDLAEASFLRSNNVS